MFLLFQRRNNTISPFRFRFKFPGRGMDVFGQGGREEALELEEERKIRRELVQVRHDLCVKTGKTAQEAATARSEKPGRCKVAETPGNHTAAEKAKAGKSGSGKKME